MKKKNMFKRPRGRLVYEGKTVKPKKGTTYFVLIHPKTGAEKEFSSEKAAKKSGWVQV